MARKSALIVSVTARVIAGGLVLEVARRSGAVAGGDPGDVGEIDAWVGAGIVISVGLRAATVRPVVGGLSVFVSVHRVRGRPCAVRLAPGRWPARGLIAAAGGG